jgi:hypothetical protein
MDHDLAKSFNVELKERKIGELFTSNFEFDTKVPLIIWLLENPQSPFALSGKISIENHDYIHILLGRGKSAQDEAFVIGFTMGNDLATTAFDVKILKFFSVFIYPKPFKFTKEDLKVFDLGLMYGRKIRTKNIHKTKMTDYADLSVESVRELFEINFEDIALFRQLEFYSVPESDTSKLLIETISFRIINLDLCECT